MNLTFNKNQNGLTYSLIGLLILISFIIFIFITTISINNKAIFLEEQVYGATSNIEVVEKRRVDLIYNLVDAVLEYQDYESKTLEKITQARVTASAGDIESAKLAINAVAEQYPDLKSDKLYQQLMTELALTENQIAQYRNNYNEQVRNYNRHIRKFPNNILLSIIGYNKCNFNYMNFDVSENAPQDLFERK